MASVPDPSGPGDLPAFDPSQSDNYTGNVMEAYNNGYTYDNLVDHHLENDIPTAPPRPSLDAVMSGNPITMDDLQTPNRDAIVEGAGKIGDAVMMGGAGLGAGLVRGAAEGIVADVAGSVSEATGIKIGAGAGAALVGSGIISMEDPDRFDKDFKSQQDLVLREEADRQNRELAARRNNGG